MTFPKVSFRYSFVSYAQRRTKNFGHLYCEVRNSFYVFVVSNEYMSFMYIRHMFGFLGHTDSKV